ncbi:MAG: hypothetical protein L3J54_09355 [Draconibacterium sp.]|nr:hypothetical protein [Draconibacterium sp.]
MFEDIFILMLNRNSHMQNRRITLAIWIRHGEWHGAPTGHFLKMINYILK